MYEIGLPQPVSSLRDGADGAFVMVGEIEFKLEACETPAGVCLQTIPRDSYSRHVPSNALPDGFIAMAESGDIRNAWYGQPTDRYAHGVLGDAIEGGSLVAVTADGKKSEFVLPEDQVFEDITPRIYDLDGDGTNEIITIRSSQAGGSALVLYGIRAGELMELGASSENGQGKRWLSVAGVVDDGEGPATVYAVRTPHIGGRLFSLTYENGTVTEENDIAGNVSNHVIGSRELGMSAVGDFDGDGASDLVLPSQDRMRLRFTLSDMPDIAMPDRIDHAIVIVNGRIVTATRDGMLLVVAP
ncbi:hypothetical protein [Oricola sp.]|uniref:hypothetical protein n=1 Tax=Oricola sp. TaxID=1979950 RepID=UPI0025FC7DF4|nr:hypothetical protein [Oricola sp.]MCI5076721.1 hypothetical protein [Oricola sp.]